MAVDHNAWRGRSLASSDLFTCVVQARMGSTRLPGKVLADLGGQPMLGFLLHRLSRLADATIVVATSDLDRDDPIEEVALAHGAAVVRGPEQDVLARFGMALERFPAATIVRITGDCPLVDPAIVRSVIELHRSRAADYTCNVLPRTYPKGLDVEVIAASALRVAIAEARDPAEREHVTPFFYRHPERFTLANLRSGVELGEERWTVDTAEDLEVVRDIVGRFAPDQDFGWQSILEIVGRKVEPVPGIRLRPARPDDGDFLLLLRNDPDAVRFSLTGSAVDPRQHDAWFRARMADPASRICIAELDGTPVGMVRVDIADAIGKVSIAVDPRQRGHGLGRKVLLALQAQWRGDVGVVRLEADVAETNTASRKAFTAIGFTEIRTVAGVETFIWDNGQP